MYVALFKIVDLQKFLDGTVLWLSNYSTFAAKIDAAS